MIVQLTTTAQTELSNSASRIRRDVLGMIYNAGSGHPGGSLSAVDILTYLYLQEMKIDPVRPDWPERDRFILSKGHACPALHAAAVQAGIIPSKLLKGFRKLNQPLQGHPCVTDTPWVETCTGSLGQGFSTAVGMAMGLRYQGQDSRVYTMLGDGELQEGMVWEAAMCAGHFKLGNLCAIIDYNKLQSDETNEYVMGIEPLRPKWEAFRWNVEEIDGHDFDEIAGAFIAAKHKKKQPTVIIAHTIKGKGVSYMEGSPLWHGSVKLLDDQFKTALADLGTCDEEIGRYLNGTINS